MNNIEKLLAKIRTPLSKDYIINNILKTNNEDGEKIINELVSNGSIIEISPNFFKLNKI